MILSEYSVRPEKTQQLKVEFMHTNVTVQSLFSRPSILAFHILIQYQMVDNKAIIIKKSECRFSSTLAHVRSDGYFDHWWS